MTLLVRDESRSTKSSCPRSGGVATVKQVSWGSTSSLTAETDCPPGTKVSLTVPPQGILRSSSPHSSSSIQVLRTSTASPQETDSRPCYSARSDTVLEICLEGEDISFIDEDDSDEVSEEVSEEVNEETEAQKIVIKLNNEAEPLLTSVVRGPPGEERQDNFDELSETSFQLGFDVTSRAPMSMEESSSGSSNETVERPVEQVGRSITSKRNLLVRQRRLDTDLHPDVTRKRHSLVLSNPPYRHSQESFNSEQ